MNKPTNKQRLAFVTGTRADFGKLEPLARAAVEAGYSIYFFVTGMHMMGKYGQTVYEVRRFEDAQHYEYINQSDGDPHDLILAKPILGFSDWVKEWQPELVIVHGDRIEAVATAMVCATNYIPCAHIEGGEVSGTIDEIYRHCNSKLCRYHFVSSDAARDRVMALGEATEDVFVIGSPELDVHKAPSGVDIQTVRKRYNIDFEDYGIVVFHPVTSEQDTIGVQARALFASLNASGREFVVISPNNDPGSDQIFATIKNLPKDRFRHIPSMRFSHFSELMRNSSAIIGNSSLGVREAPFLGLQSLNLGTRQSDRAMATSVTHSTCEDHARIGAFLTHNWGIRCKVDGSFGIGNAASQFVKILDTPGFWDRPKQKKFVDKSSIST